MITIHLKKGDKQSQHAFTKERIVIGSSQQADIIVNEQEIEAEHLIITKENGRYKVFNAANDPFASLNTLPFGKRILKEGDLVSLHSLALQIENLEEEKSTQNFQESVRKTTEKETKEKKYFEASPLKQPFLTEKISSEEEPIFLEEAPSEEEPALDFLKPRPIRASTHEIEELLNAFMAPSQKEEKKVRRPAPVVKEHVEEHRDEDTIKKRKTPVLMWLMVTMMVATVLYLYLIEQQKISVVEEREAGRGVSDVAMTLLYAQMNHLEPSKLDWTSSASLRRLSRYVLFPRYSYAIHREGYDLLAAGRHNLEVYYSENGDHFLVVARPQTLKWLSWWKNSPSIVLDSNDMRLRKVEKMEDYDTFLNQDSYLKAEDSRMLTLMLNKENVLPFSALTEEGHTEFLLPSLLEDHSEEENLVYNLPRYSSFTDLLLGKIILQRKRIGASVNGRYREQLQGYLKLKDLVLYSTQDLGKVFDGLQGNIPEGSSLQIVKIDSNGAPVSAATIHSLSGGMIPATNE